MRLALSIVAAVAVAAALVVAGGRDAQRFEHETSRLTAGAVMAQYVAGETSRGRWVAMHPRLNVDQIKMVCGISNALARRYEAALEGEFSVPLLERVEADCA